MAKDFSSDNRTQSVSDSVYHQMMAKLQSKPSKRPLVEMPEYSKIVFVPDLPNNSFDVYFEDEWLGSAFPYCNHVEKNVSASLNVNWCFVDSKHGQIYQADTLERLKYRIDIAYWVK